MKKFSLPKFIATVALSTLIPAFLSAQTTSYGTGAGSGGSDNSMFGASAGRVTTGYSNLFMGKNAAYNNTSGYSNVFLGRSAGYNNTSGNGNVFIGRNAGFKNTTQLRNVFIGWNAGFHSTSYNNTYIGYFAGRNSSSGSNTFIGAYAGEGTTIGTQNVYIGGRVARNNPNGSHNVILGELAGGSSTEGSKNVSIGFGAGTKAETRNVLIGYQAGFNAASNNVIIGNLAGFYETGSNKLYISNSNTSTPLIYGDFSTKKLGINARPSGSHTLSVGGSIISEEVVVKLQKDWPDFVFEKGYTLPSLAEVEMFIKEHKHLPNIPSEVEVQEKGINVEEITVKLLQKIEELTLYTIELEKKVVKLENALVD